MSDAATLKDFLVGIGFKVDQIAQKQAEEAVRRTEERNTDRTEKESEKRRKIEAKEAADREKERKGLEKKEQERRAKSLKDAQSYVLKMSAFAVKAVAAVEASAIGVVYAVDKAAKSFERLNYMSQRTGSAPGRIGAFGYASSQLGSSAEEANSSLESFGQKLRINGSGYAQALERLGIKARDANGHLRDSADLATDLGDALRRIQQNGGQYGYSNAITQASVFGFDENTTRALMNPDFRKREGEYKSDQKAIGADPDAAAKTGTAFEQSMGHLNEVLGQIETKLAGVLFKKLKPLLDDLSDWFTAHGDKVADIIGRIADDMVSLAEAIGKKLADADWDKILDHIEELAKGFGAVADKLAGEKGLVVGLAAVLASLRAMALLRMPVWLLGMLGLGGTAALVAGGAAGVAGGYLQHKLDPNDPGIIEDTKQKDAGIVDRLQNGFDWAHRKWRHRPKLLGGSGDSQGGGDDSSRTGGNEALARRGHSSRNTEDLVRHAKAQLEAEGVPKENSSAAAAALVGNVIQESGGDPTKVHDGGTGYGLYGARLGRRDRMFAWLKANKYDRDSAEGQMKYMAHEAMTDPGYARTAKALRGATPENLGSVTNTVATNFESPAPRTANYAGRRNNAAAALQRIPPMPSRFRAGAPLKDAPHLIAPGVPQGMTGGGYMALGLDASGRPVRLGDTPAWHQSISNSTRGDTVVTHNPTFNITGGDGPATLEAARRMASRGHQDLLRNIQGMEQ